MKNPDYHELNTAELINIITNDKTGCAGKSVSYKTCDSVNCLSMLCDADLEELEGIGTTRARQIRAAIELGCRLRREHRNLTKIRSTQDVIDVVFDKFYNEKIEHFYALFLRNSNALIKCEKMSTGGISGVPLDIRLLLREALNCYATKIILVHNHPSGTNRPSQEDRDLTLKVLRAAETMDIRLIDHIIVTSDDRAYYSFNEACEI